MRQAPEVLEGNSVSCRVDFEGLDRCISYIWQFDQRQMHHVENANYSGREKLYGVAFSVIRIVGRNEANLPGIFKYSELVGLNPHDRYLRLVGPQVFGRLLDVVIEYEDDLALLQLQ
jgi:hypothetical protein